MNNCYLCIWSWGEKCSVIYSCRFRHNVPGKLLLHVGAWRGPIPRGLLCAGCGVHRSALCHRAAVRPTPLACPDVTVQKTQTGWCTLGTRLCLFTLPRFSSRDENGCPSLFNGGDPVRSALSIHLSREKNYLFNDSTGQMFELTSFESFLFSQAQ